MINHKPPAAASPPEIQRPHWLTIFCLALWCIGLLDAGLIIFLSSVIIARNLLILAIPIATLIAAGVDLWSMKKRGGLLWGIYLGFEGLRLLTLDDLPFTLLPISAFLFRTYQGSEVATVINLLYLLGAVSVGGGLWRLWRSGRLS